MQIVAVVLAGGLGMQLWPRSTERSPKQFIHVQGDGTLIQNSVMRMLPFVEMKDIHVVTTMDLFPLVQDQLPAIPQENILCEPFGRNTAPAIAFASLQLMEKLGPDTIIVALPSDHIIHNVREFHVTLDRACTAAASEDAIITIGVTPSRPEPGFGYIQVGSVVETPNHILKGYVHRVHTFAEKPDVDTAQRFLDAGDFVWNSGIFVGRAKVFLEAINKHLPDHAPLFQTYKRALGSDEEKGTLEMIYKQMRSVSFDIGVMEKADNALVVDGAFDWTDVGTWDEIYRISMKDGKNNVIEGNVVTLNTTNSFVAGSTGRVIGVVNMDNVMVIETESSLLIVQRGKAEKTRDLVDLLKRRHISRHL